MNSSLQHNGQLYLVERITTLQQVTTWWPFFLEGLPELNQMAREGRELSPEILLKTLLACLEKSQENALVIVLKSKNDKPLGWGIVFNNTWQHRPRSCVVFGVYSNGKSASTSRAGLVCIEKWAKENDYKEIQAFSYNFNGSRFRLFEKVWKFQRAATLFVKEL